LGLYLVIIETPVATTIASSTVINTAG